ncbi:MAG: glycoside hydrolase family 15 protein [Nocardioidaceae bacterium]
MSETPIGDYALLSDRNSAALVSKDGSVDWLCFPRFDSPSVFGALLDPQAGHWSIRPAGPYGVSRKYVGPTMVLETRFETPTGDLVVTDALVVSSTDDPHRLGADAPGLLIRSLRCEQGAVEVDLHFRARPEYGLVVPLLTATEGGVLIRGGTEWMALAAPVELTIERDVVTARWTMLAEERVDLALHRSDLARGEPRLRPPQEIAACLADTINSWTSWSDLHQNYEGPWRHLVHHSGRVLAALSYQPTGAIVAAATTSLPEEIGGERNWDYRFAWIRDASFTMEALWVAACPDEAHEFFEFMLAAAASYRPQDSLQIMYGIGGERDLTERQLEHLSGWRGSQPVRIGNGAWQQTQIDVYGELLGAAYRYRDHLPAMGPPLSRFLAALADGALSRWQEPDNGIWEIRGEPRHFTYSKLMCWMALDRAVEMADVLPPDAPLDTWASARDEIQSVILRDGWSDAAGAYTQSFGSDALDASVLMMPIVGFVAADDPRMDQTITAIAERLTDDRGLVFRYRTEEGVDGLAGDEGTFLLCTFWLAQAQALAGRIDEARATFERAVAHVNDVGLLAEEVDSATGELLGNFPQAFSHIGLVNAAWAIAERENHATDD